MENQGRKINLSGGNSKQTSESTRGPYKKDIFKKFVEWSAMTDEEKVSCGIPNARAFASKHKLHSSQLSRWTQRKDFNTLKFERMRESWSEFVPEAFEALRKRIQRFGMARDVELWLAYTEGWDRKKAAEQRAPPSFTEDDIRNLLSFLPREEQIKFWQLIAKILLRAQELQENNNQKL